MKDQKGSEKQVKKEDKNYYQLLKLIGTNRQVYKGGHHYVVCDGEDHWQIFDNGQSPHFDCKCSEWFGGCPAPKLFPE